MQHGDRKPDKPDRNPTGEQTYILRKVLHRAPVKLLVNLSEFGPLAYLNSTCRDYRDVAAIRTRSEQRAFSDWKERLPGWIFTECQKEGQYRNSHFVKALMTCFAFRTVCYQHLFDVVVLACLREPDSCPAAAA